MKERKYIIQFFVILIGLVYIIRLLNIQIFDDTYAKKAEDNIISREIQYPYRGVIYDRNKKLLVFNQPEYDIQVIPREAVNIDKEKFCSVFGISEKEYDKKMDEARHYSRNKPSIFIKQLSNEDLAKAQDNMVFFSGFQVKARSGRAYKYNVLANALGYVSEISKSNLERDTTNYYRQGDYVGQSGIEAYYEEYLRGKRGVAYKTRNVKGEFKGIFNDGLYDTLSIPGQDLYTSIDLDLQQYSEFLLQNKTGSIIAIEPSTGEILSFVSGPSYDPGKLTGRDFGANFVNIAKDSLKPLFNRPLMAQYRPGSIFKIIQAMVGLQEGTITPETRITCNRSIIGCHGAHSYEDLEGAIQHSCNPYFYNAMRRTVLQNKSNDIYEDTRLGLEVWSEHVATFGLGSPLGIDLPNEKSGLVPSVSYYDRAYHGEAWKFSNIYSIAIGEGENLVVPLQMANFASIIANRGYYITPHIVKGIGENGSPLPQYIEKHYTSINSEYFDVAVDAMEKVVAAGTGIRAKIPGIEVCGKTGTVQNRDYPDHSVFIAFAPKDNPQIAVSVYVEKSGQGGRAAAGIAGLLIEKYLTGEIKRKNIEDYVLKGHFIY